MMVVLLDLHNDRALTVAGSGITRVKLLDFRRKLGANNRNLRPLEQTCRNNDVLRLNSPRPNGDGLVAQFEPAITAVALTP
jgi:hypothetical protein